MGVHDLVAINLHLIEKNSELLGIRQQSCEPKASVEHTLRLSVSWWTLEGPDHLDELLC